MFCGDLFFDCHFVSCRALFCFVVRVFVAVDVMCCLALFDCVVVVVVVVWCYVMLCVLL